MDSITCTHGTDCPVPHDVWLGASFRREAPALDHMPYPHICDDSVPHPVAQPWRDCPACVSEKQWAADRS